MPAKKGQKKTPGSGRKRGTPNKNTIAAREAFQLAFDKIGGSQGLATWAKKNPTEFYKIYGRLIPVDVTGNSPSKIVVEMMQFGENQSPR